MSEKTLRICHLYPDLLNLYGDRGNILCMRRRLEWRGIGAEVTEVRSASRRILRSLTCFSSAAGRTLSRRGSCPT